jgi:hypothetical protein
MNPIARPSLILGKGLVVACWMVLLGLLLSAPQKNKAFFRYPKSSVVSLSPLVLPS